jgi:hypothetical protein
MVSEDVVMRVDTFLGEIMSMTLTDCEKVACRYTNRKAAEMRSPVIRVVNCLKVSTIDFSGLALLTP